MICGLKQVSEKNRCKVTISFPSKQSLDNHMSVGESCYYPNLDMSFTMEIKLAPKVLVRQLTYPDINNLEDLKAFWMVNTLLVPKLELEEVSTRYLSSSTIDSEEEEKVDEIDNKPAPALVVKEENIDEEHIPDNNRKRKKFKWWSYER